MADLQALVGASIAEAQDGVTPGAGQMYVRGTTLVQVLRVAGGKVRWREADGTLVDAPLAAYRSQALERVEIDRGGGTLLDRAWTMVNGRSLPKDVRIAILRRVLDRRLPAPDAAEVQQWLLALLAGDEPRRSQLQESPR